MITKFYGYYISIFDSFYKLMEKESLIFLLNNNNQYWDMYLPIGSQFFVGLDSGGVTLLFREVELSGGSTTLCFPNFVDCPIRLLHKTLSLNNPKMKEYLHAMVDKWLPVFWRDLGIILNNMKPINLDILNINTPKNIESVTIIDKYLLIYVDNDAKPLIYSINELPSEYRILQKIKKRFLQ